MSILGGVIFGLGWGALIMHLVWLRRLRRQRDHWLAIAEGRSSRVPWPVPGSGLLPPVENCAEVMATREQIRQHAEGLSILLSRHGGPRDYWAWKGRTGRAGTSVKTRSSNFP